MKEINFFLIKKTGSLLCILIQVQPVHLGQQRKLLMLLSTEAECIFATVNLAHSFSVEPCPRQYAVDRSKTITTRPS